MLTGIGAVLVPFFCASFPSLSFAEETPSAEQVMSSVAAAERALINVQIHNFRLTKQIRGKDSTDWKTSLYTIAGDAWYNGLRNSKVRVDVSRGITKWTGGSDPWAEYSRDYSFDGKIGRLVNRASGRLGTVIPEHTGELLPDAPPELRDRYQGYADGTSFSLNFYDGDGSGGTLSHLFAQARSAKLPLYISWDSVFGDRVLRVSLINPGVRKLTFWLDPAHGYALRKAERTADLGAPDPLILESTEVPQLTNAGGGIWFPIAASRDGMDPDPGNRGGREKLWFQADKVEANDPSFDEGGGSPAGLFRRQR